jgi:hypothetical protein
MIGAYGSITPNGQWIQRPEQHLAESIVLPAWRYYDT